MKSVILVFCVVVVSVLNLAFTNSQYRTWESKNGSKIEAKYIKYDKEAKTILLEDKSAKQYKCGFDNLSNNDKQYISFVSISDTKNNKEDEFVAINNSDKEKGVYGYCKVVKQASYSEYLFVCKLYYNEGLTNTTRRIKIEVAPKLRSDVGTFSPSKNFGTKTEYRTVTETITNTIEKLVIVKGLPWTERQFTTSRWSNTLPFNGGKVWSSSTDGKQYTGKFTTIEEDYKYEGNSFKFLQYTQSD